MYAEEAPLGFDVVEVDEVAEGWEDGWRAFHRGVRVGRCWVGPPWEEPPGDAVAVVIDPGRAFGTGAHPTTRLCLELPPGTQPGEIVVLRGRGMPVLQGRGRGDQRILVNVLVPRRLSDEQRRLLREFDEHADDHTYGKSEGLFDKLKSAFR